MYDSLSSAEAAREYEEIQEVLKMYRSSCLLADYVIKKGMVDEEERDVYEYGFQIGIELGCFVLYCIALAAYMDMLIGGALFFLIFAPLRAYAGGLHLERFHSCFILSCLTYSAVLALVKYVQAPQIPVFLLVITFGAAVYILYPVENNNRKVDEEDDRYFRKKLRIFLSLHFGLAALCLAMGWDKYLFEIFLVYFIVVSTMAVGKAKQKE